MKSVSVINFKGGVGKTTLSFHLACYLAQTHKVLLIDIDHQSSLSIVMLGASLWAKCVTSGRTGNKIFESFCNRRVAMPNDCIIVKNALFERGERKRGHNLYPNLDFVSAQFELDDTEIDLASTTYGSPTLSDWEKRTLLATWLDGVDAIESYDYVIFDCPPATKIISQNALVASDKYIIPVIPEEISSRGVTHFRNLVKTKIDDKLEFLKTNARVPASDVPDNYVPTTELAGVVPFLIGYAGNAASGITNLHTEQLAALRKQWKTDITTAQGKRYTGIAEALNEGWPVWNSRGTNAKAAVINMMKAICAELKTRIDT